MKFTSHIIVIASNYDCYMLYGKDTEPNQRRLDLHIIQLESHFCQIIRDKKYIEQNGGDLNVVILHSRAGIQSDTE